MDWNDLAAVQAAGRLQGEARGLALACDGLTEAVGDDPGCLVEIVEDIVAAAWRRACADGDAACAIPPVWCGPGPFPEI